MKKSRLVYALSSTAIMLLCLSPIASADNPGTGIESRIARQQGKIGNKRASKKISAEQASRADNATYRIANQEQEMRTKHHGKLTRRDKAKLNRELNRNDRIINGETKKGKTKN